MIDIKIFPVEKGFCAAIELGPRHTILIDCGSGNKFKPAQYICQKHCEYLDYLILPAYTKDHLSGFLDFVNQLTQHEIPVHFLLFNPSLDLEQLSDVKPFPLPLNNSLKTLKEQSQTIEIEELKLTFFENKSPLESAHNLSLVTFIHYRDINMILPGDLEQEGWLHLLESDSFKQNLAKVNIFVASNHGLENGYCEEVFNYCHPEVIIISNKENQPLSDEMMQKYSDKAKGTISGISKQKIITTYDEGTIVVSKYLDCLRHIVTQKQTNSSVYS